MLERSESGGLLDVGHHETAQAKVLFAEMVITAWEEEHHTTYEFVLEVQPPNGQAFREKTRHAFPSFTPHPEVGDVVYVKYDPKSLKIELHLHGDNRYGWEGEKHKEQMRHQAEQAQRDALLAAPPGTPLPSSHPRGGAGMAGLDPELQALMHLEEAERRAQQAGGQQQWNVQAVQMPGGFPGMAAQVDPQAAMALSQAQMLRQELEQSGASGRRPSCGSRRWARRFTTLPHFSLRCRCSQTAWVTPFNALSRPGLIPGRAH